ncbi:MAG: hypothetical protein ACFWT3_14305 [Pseudomonas lundensis]
MKKSHICRVNLSSWIFQDVFLSSNIWLFEVKCERGHTQVSSPFRPGSVKKAGGYSGAWSRKKTSESGLDCSAL